MVRATRGQSETIGVVLLTVVVALVAFGVGAVMIDTVTSQADDGPAVNIGASATTQHVTVEHLGGDSVDTDEVTVIIDGDTRERYPLESFTERTGGDSTRFEPGDTWRYDNDVEGDRLRVIAVHDPSSRVLDEESVTVEVTIAARFSYTPDQPTSLDTVTFDAGDSEIEEGSSLTSYEWDFDDDGTTDATGEATDYTFPDDGIYPVTLTVMADDGRTDNATRTVRVFNEFPDAAFTYSPTVPEPGETVSFDASGSTDPDGTIVGYEWDFTDDGTVDATGETATTSYGSEGNYTVRLNVTDDDGASTKRGEVVEVVSSGPPVVTITSSSISETGGSGKYDISVTFEASDPDDDIANYTAALYNSSSKTVLLDSVSSPSYDGTSTTVALNDTETQNGKSPLYVLVKVGDNTSQVGTDSVTLSADNTEPTASFTYSPSNPGPGESVSFDASGSSDTDGDSLSYEWDFGDGTTTTGKQVSHSYGSSGSYDVTLTVRDGNGGVDSSTQTVSVGSGGGGGTDVTSGTASDLSGPGRQTQTFTVSLGDDLSAGEDITIDLSDTDRAQKKEDITYSSPSTTSPGTASLSGKTLTYSPSGSETSGDTITITVDAQPESKAKGNTYSVTFTGADGSSVQDMFSV